MSSPYKNTSEIPQGFGADHEADGVLKILPEFEPILDIKPYLPNIPTGKLRRGWLAEAEARQDKS